jgi:hypothetical protein
MAECLTELIIPAKVFQYIFVKNESTKLLVEQKLKEKYISGPYVNIQKWF